MSCVASNSVLWIMDQLQHKPGCTAAELKFQIMEVEGLYFHCSENIGADQLCG